MTAHPLMEIQYEFRMQAGPGDELSGPWVVRHQYHTPNIGHNVYLTEGDKVYAGTIYEMLWEDEVLVVRVR